MGTPTSSVSDLAVYGLEAQVWATADTLNNIGWDDYIEAAASADSRGQTLYSAQEILNHADYEAHLDLGTSLPAEEEQLIREKTA